KKEMLDCYKEMNDYNGNNAESYIFRLSKKFRNDPRFLFRFRNQVQFDGVCGLITADFLESYNSPKARLKNYIRHMLRVLFPNVWF
ncbi:MAG: hypothetical protein Q4E68_06140, partial [Prevotellaceae bacterium]|nr:hypothetical protein [Prevotellaceae bacterium]